MVERCRLMSDDSRITPAATAHGPFLLSVKQESQLHPAFGCFQIKAELLLWRIDQKCSIHLRALAPSHIDGWLLSWKHAFWWVLSAHAVCTCPYKKHKTNQSNFLPKLMFLDVNVLWKIQIYRYVDIYFLANRVLLLVYRRCGCTVFRVLCMLHVCTQKVLPQAINVPTMANRMKSPLPWCLTAPMIVSLRRSEAFGETEQKETDLTWSFSWICTDTSCNTC